MYKLGNNILSLNNKLIYGFGGTIPPSGYIARYQFETDYGDDTNTYADFTYPYYETSLYAGKVGNAVYVEQYGNNVYLDDSSLMGVIGNQNACSFSFWWKIDSPVNNARYNMGFVDSSFGAKFCLVFFEFFGNKRFLYFDRQSNANLITSQFGILNYDEWYHIVITYAGSSSDRKTKIYKNGNTTPIYEYTEAPTDATFNYFNAIGCYYYSENAGTNGMDQLYFYDKELTSAEVAQLYNSGSGV